MPTIEPTTTTLETAPSCETPPHAELQTMLGDAEMLIRDFRNLLVKSQDALETIGVKDEVEVIERWVESYRRGISAANKMSTSGAEIIDKLKNRLKLAADEISRLEGEGGNTEVTKEQQKHIEQLMMAYSRFEKLIPQIEHIFTTCNINQS